MIIAAMAYSAIAVAYAPAEFVSRMPRSAMRSSGQVLDAGRDAMDPTDTGGRDRALQQQLVDPRDDEAQKLAIRP